MIPLQILLIAIGALLADAQECKCECDSNNVCDEQNALRTVLDETTAQLAKLSRHYNIVTSLATDWQSQVAHVVREQLKVGTNESVDGRQNPLRNERDRCCEQNEDILDRLEYLELSVWELQEQATDSEFTMAKISDEMEEIRTELHREKRKPECGVDIDHGDSNVAGSRDLVWPWMAAVYRKGGTEFVCYGSVIHHNFVLTTAWCALYFGDRGLTVKLGLSDLKSGKHVQEYNVQAFHIHRQTKRPPGQQDNLDYDISLLELERPITFGPFVKAVCLPPRGITLDETFYQPNSEAKAVYLTSYIRPPHSESPSIANLTILTHERCRSEIKKKGMGNIFPHAVCFILRSNSFCMPISGNAGNTVSSRERRHPNMDPSELSRLMYG